MSVLLRGSGCFAACGLALAAVATVLPAAGQGWRGSLGVASEQVQRGIRISGGATAFAFALARAAEGPGPGLGLVVQGPAYPLAGGEGQLRVYGSYLWQPADDRAYELQLSRYQALGSPGARHYAHTELMASGAWRVGASSLLLALRMAPDEGLFLPGAGFVRGTAASLEATLSRGLGHGFALEAGLGWQHWELDRSRPYAYGHAGMAWQQGAARLSMLRVQSQARERLGLPASRGAARWVGSATWAF